jgi:hypothetical protein
MALIKTLPRIAARILHNTHVGRQNMKEKFELLAAAYGANAVEEDFEKWCEEQVALELIPRYPITDYIKVVDTRLGPKFSDKKADLKDPNISAISAVAYEKTGILPSVRSVANLLASFSLEEILGALTEYASTLDDKEVKTGMHNFFTEGGATAVIYARQRRKSA